MDKANTIGYYELMKSGDILNKLNLESNEGRLLIGALQILSTTLYRNDSPDNILRFMSIEAEQLFKRLEEYKKNRKD